jgi:hypothetical protein
MSTKFATERILDEEIDVEVTSGGVFTAEYNDQSYDAKTLDELRARLLKAVKRAKATKAVDVTMINYVPKSQSGNHRFVREDPYETGVGFVHAKLRSKHERSSAWLLTSDDGTKFQVSSYGSVSQNICRRLTLAEALEYDRLAKALAAAEEALEAWTVTVRLDPEKALGIK